MSVIQLSWHALGASDFVIYTLINRLRPTPDMIDVRFESANSFKFLLKFKIAFEAEVYGV